MRFLHSADWQLGKSFGRFEPDLRAALGEARFDAIDAIGGIARDEGILLTRRDRAFRHVAGHRLMITTSE
jgi:DNA repair exonuclease SbcCD nuclease subunit